MFERVLYNTDPGIFLRESLYVMENRWLQGEASNAGGLFTSHLALKPTQFANIMLAT